jgi:Histidine kinase-like ATPase domain
MTTNPADTILWVPADAGSIHVLRTVAASVGARADLSVDELDDVRLAVTEAASHLLAGRQSGSTICMRLSPTDRGIRVRVTIPTEPDSVRPGNDAESPDETIRSVERSLAWQILLALGEDLQPVADAREFGVTFAKARSRDDVP